MFIFIARVFTVCCESVASVQRRRRCENSSLTETLPVRRKNIIILSIYKFTNLNNKNENSYSMLLTKSKQIIYEIHGRH